MDAVSKDIESLQFNTAIAKMMEFINDFTKLSTYPKNAVKMATQALMPFAPHLAEEIWQQLGGEGELTHAAYPKADPKYLEELTTTYVVQVNGKLRGRFELPKDQSEQVVVEAAKAHPVVSKYLAEGNLQKVIFVPNRLLNFVVKS